MLGSPQLAGLLLEGVDCGYTRACATLTYRQSWVLACALLGTLPAVQATHEHLHGEAVGFLTESSVCAARQLQLSGSSLH